MLEQPLPKRLLVVDDQETDLALLRRFLKLWSDRTGIQLEITERNNGESALHVAQSVQRHGRRGFDLIITDHSMPRMTGIEFLRTFRQQDKDTCVILRSSDPAGGTLPTEVHALGATFLEKDPQPDGFYVLLDRFLR